MSDITVLEEIAHGGFGRVDRARLSDGSLIAKKTFAPSFPMPPHALEKARKRFVREAKTQEALGGDFVMPVLLKHVEGLEPWYVMPLANRSYGDQIQDDLRAGTLNSEALADILNALEIIHSLDYVHRDLKPANILLHEGRWKLSDFGLALPPPGFTTKLTSAGSAWGTREYAAPEQATDFGSVTPSADIFAFGCILHDLTTAEPKRIPFHQVVEPGPLGTVIAKCTEKNADDRYPTIAALRGALFSALSASDGPAIAPTQADVQWMSELPGVGTWTAERFAEFAKFLSTLDMSRADEPVFRSLDESRLEALATRGGRWADVIIGWYCTWAETALFAWAYYDVVAARLSVAIRHGSLTSRAAATIALARLGKRHDRWYIMLLLVEACGADLDVDAARRIAVEVQVEDVAPEFLASVQVLGLGLDVFHQEIARVLSRRLVAPEANP